MHLFAALLSLLNTFNRKTDTNHPKKNSLVLCLYISILLRVCPMQFPTLSHPFDTATQTQFSRIFQLLNVRQAVRKFSAHLTFISTGKKRERNADERQTEKTIQEGGRDYVCARCPINTIPEWCSMECATSIRDSLFFCIRTMYITIYSGMMVWLVRANEWRRADGQIAGGRLRALYRSAGELGPTCRWPDEER